MTETEAQVDAHNRRMLWQDVAARLAVIVHEIGQINGLLDDLGSAGDAKYATIVSSELIGVEQDFANLYVIAQTGARVA